MIEEGLGMLAHGAPVNIKLVLTKEGSGVRKGWRGKKKDGGRERGG